jgi:hypothetical protein
MTFATRMRAYHPEWLKGPATFDGEYIVMTRHLTQPYRLVGDWALLFDLAAVRRPDDAIAFVRKHGMLRHGTNSAFLREPFSEWLEAAYTLSNLLDLYNLIQAASDEDTAARETLWETWAVRLRPLLQPMPTSDAELLSGASRALATLVNEGLRNVQVQINSEVEWAVGRNATGSPRAFTLAPGTPDLLGVSYLTLAMLVSLRMPLRTCRGCRRRFAPTHASQQYHDRACAIQARQRKMSAKQKKRVPASDDVRKEGIPSAAPTVTELTPVAVLPIKPGEDEELAGRQGGAPVVAQVGQRPSRKGKSVLMRLGRGARRRA